MGFEKRRTFILCLALVFGVGLQTLWSAAGLEAFSSAPAPFGVRNPFFDVSENIIEEQDTQKTPREVQGAHKGRVWRKLAVLVALGISVAVAFQFHRRALGSLFKPREGSASTPKDDSRSDERLEKVRGLVATASMIAEAIDSPEATEQMDRLQEDLAKADMLQREGGNAEEVEAYLIDAIDCVQALHGQVIEGADEIVEQSKVVSLSPLLDAKEPNPIAEMQSLESFHETAVRPYLKSLSSVYKISEALSSSAKAVHGELTKTDAAAQDDDLRQLQSTAARISSLFSTVEVQKHVEQLAKGLVSGSANGLKVTMLAEREAKRFRFQVGIDIARLHLNQSRIALENTPDSAKEDASWKEKAAILSSVEEELQDISGKVSELLEPAKRLRTSHSLRDMLAVCSESQDTEDEVSADLDRIVGMLSEFEPKTEELGEESKQAMNEAVEKYRQFVAGKHEVTKNACEDVERRVEGVIIKGKLPSATAMQRQHARVAEHVRSKMNQAMELSDEEMRYAESALLELQTVDKLSTAAQALEGLKVIGNSIIHQKEESLLELLNVHLISILQQDIVYIAKEEDAIVSDPRYLDVNQEKMQALHSNFRAALEEAESSGTIQEMAEAAAAMRAYYTQIKGLFC